jgi:hypothetical protein
MYVSGVALSDSPVLPTARRLASGGIFGIFPIFGHWLPILKHFTRRMVIIWCAPACHVNATFYGRPKWQQYANKVAFLTGGSTVRAVAGIGKASSVERQVAAGWVEITPKSIVAYFCLKISLAFSTLWTGQKRQNATIPPLCSLLKDLIESLSGRSRRIGVGRVHVSQR